MFLKKEPVDVACIQAQKQSIQFDSVQTVMVIFIEKKKDKPLKQTVQASFCGRYQDAWMSSDFAPLTVLMISSWFIRCQNVCWELRGSRVCLLTAEKQCQSRSQTTGEQLRSQARLIDILTYCTFPGRGLPCGNTLLPYSPPLRALILSMWRRS